MSARIIPVTHVLTDEAIEELVGADPHHRRLKAKWQAATGEAKNKAYIEVSERQNQITDRLYEAVKSHDLQPIALQRTLAGGWEEHGIPKRYREALGGELALWRGSVQKMELERGDEWIRGAALCFRRSDFDAWVGSTIVVRPLGAEDLPTWWTVPESAVWIATRDLSQVQSLDNRARASLFVASELVPGTYEASFELLAGLRDGRLLASGWPRGKHGNTVSQEIPPDFWKAPTAFSGSEIGVEGLRGPGDAMVGLLLESDEVMAKWESPQSLLDGDRIPVGTFIGRLMHESWPAYLLRHPEVVVTGLNQFGQQVEIDKDVFQTNSTVDRSTHSVRTADGRLHWSAVMVRRRKDAKPDTVLRAKGDGKRLIAFAQAARQVHRALCGDEAITSLTSRERWLGTLDYLDAEMKDLGSEWQQAVNQVELWRHQCEEANDWLESRGFTEGDDGLLDRLLFEEVFATAFPALVKSERSSSVVETPRVQAEPSKAALEPTTAKSADLSARQLELLEWGTKVCQTVSGAGRRIARGAFIDVAWMHFGTSSGLTVDGISAAWRTVRKSAGWLDAGTIRERERIRDDELRDLLIEAQLLRKGPSPNN